MQFIAKNNKQQGFTLLELLISIVIVSVIITIMFSAMRLGLRAWEKGEEDIEFMHRLRIVKAQIKRQMSSICTESFLKTGKSRDLVPFILKGDDRSVEFISRYSIIPGSDSALVYTKYYLKETGSDKESLVMFEKDVTLLSFEELQKVLEVPDNYQEYTLVENIEQFEMKYLMKDKNNNQEWISSWNIDQKESKFPIAVTVNGTVNDIPVSVVARLMSESKESE